MATFEQALENLVTQFAKRYEGTENGYLIELHNGEFIDLAMFSDTNDLEDFKEREDDEDEEEEDDEVPEELYLCNKCDEMYHDEMNTGDCKYCDESTFRVVDKGDMGFM